MEIKTYYDISENIPLFAIGDIHGDFMVLRHILVNLTKVCLPISPYEIEWEKGNGSFLVFTGDILDARRRQINPVDLHKETMTDIDIFKLLIRLKYQAQDNGGDIIILVGNHELMNLEHNFDYSYGSSYRTNQIEELYDLIKNHCLISVKINNNIFVHGGIPNMTEPDDLMKLHNQNKLLRLYCDYMNERKFQEKERNLFQLLFSYKKLDDYDNIPYEFIEKFIKIVKDDYPEITEFLNNFESTYFTTANYFDHEKFRDYLDNFRLKKPYDFNRYLLGGEDSFLWNRDYGLGKLPETDEVIEDLVKKLHFISNSTDPNIRLLVGHTIQPTRMITIKYKGRVICLDVAMSRAFEHLDFDTSEVNHEFTKIGFIQCFQIYPEEKILTELVYARDYHEQIVKKQSDSHFTYHSLSKITWVSNDILEKAQRSMENCKTYKQKYQLSKYIYNFVNN